ncbi:hypothetical protein M3Y99_00916300 [Aphelenchoides fujianensis]|nr:hypothetical protein M3Y99_00916300 [Aphelenchoides fujianensis]
MKVSQQKRLLQLLGFLLLAGEFGCFWCVAKRMSGVKKIVEERYDNTPLMFFGMYYLFFSLMFPLTVLFSATRGGGIFLTAARRRWIPALKVFLVILCTLALLLIPGLPIFVPNLPPFSVLSVGCLLNAGISGTALLMLWVLEREYYETMDEVKQENEEVGRPLTAEQTETAVELRRRHELINAPARYARHGGKLDEGRVHAVHADDFFQLHKWLHELEWAKRNGQTAEVLDRLQTEMEERTRLYRLPADEQRRYEELARVEAERDCVLHSQRGAYR